MFKQHIDSLDVIGIKKLLLCSPEIEIIDGECPISYLFKTYHMQNKTSDTDFKFEDILISLYNYYCEIEYYSTFDRIRELDDNFYDFKYSHLFDKPCIVVQEYTIECPICLNNYEFDDVAILKCGHIYCQSCCFNIDKCSICRKSKQIFKC